MSCKALSPSSFLEKASGKLKALQRVYFFVWTIAWGKILTGDNFRIRGFAFVDCCVMCHCCSEFVDHLLLHCAKTHRLWCFAFQSFGVLWVLPRTVLEFLLVDGIGCRSILQTFGIWFCCV